MLFIGRGLSPLSNSKLGFFSLLSKRREMAIPRVVRNGEEEAEDAFFEQEFEFEDTNSVPPHLLNLFDAAENGNLVALRHALGNYLCFYRFVFDFYYCGKCKLVLVVLERDCFLWLWLWFSAWSWGGGGVRVMLLGFFKILHGCVEGSNCSVF